MACQRSASSRGVRYSAPGHRRRRGGDPLERFSHRSRNGGLVVAVAGEMTQRGDIPGTELAPIREQGRQLGAGFIDPKSQQTMTRATCKGFLEPGTLRAVEIAGLLGRPKREHAVRRECGREAQGDGPATLPHTSALAACLTPQTRTSDVTDVVSLSDLLSGSGGGIAGRRPSLSEGRTALTPHVSSLQHRRLKKVRREKKINGPPPQPTLPAVRHAIVALMARPPPQRCPHCRKWICTKTQRE